MLRTSHLIIILILFINTSLLAQDATKSEVVNNVAIKDSIEYLLKKSYKAESENKVTLSMDYATRAIKYATQIEDKLQMYHGYNTIGVNYEKIKEYSSAEYSYKKALTLALELENDKYKVWSYNNLGNVYSDGYKKINLGLSYYKKSLNLARKIKDTFEMSVPIINIAWTHLDEKKYDKALPYLTEGYNLVYDKSSDDEYSKININYLLARYYRGIKEFDKAWEYLSVATESALKEEMLTELTEIYKEQSELYEDQGLPGKALEALKKQYLYKAKMDKNNREEEIQIARAQFDFEESQIKLAKAQKEKQLQETIAKRSRIITLISVLVVIIMFILLMALYKNYADKNKMSSMLQAQNDTLEKAKIEAEKLSQLKTQFISTVSHELRTPLYGVVGLTSLLLEESNLSKKAQQYLNSLKFSGDYLLNLINDILNLSKIESNKVSFEKTPFNIRDLVQDVINSFKFQLI